LITFQFIEKTRIIKKLFHHGAKIDDVDNKGRTAFVLAMQNKKENIAKLISDNSSIGRCVVTASLMQRDNSYFNVFIFVILHLSAQIICLLYLMPGKIYF
jgi:hypothetical protein